MNDNITGRKDWFFEPHIMSNFKPDGKITVILEEEGRRLVKVEFNNRKNIFCHSERPLYYIQRPYINPITGKGHWVDVHYDRSKNKMIRRFKLNEFKNSQ